MPKIFFGKTNLCFCLAFTIVLMAATTGFARQGDVDSDGAITINDGLLVAQYAGGIYPGPITREEGDVNWDESINIYDALLITQFAAGIITEFPCPNPAIIGHMGYQTITYASSIGVQKIEQYMNPTAGYGIARRLDLSIFQNLMDTDYWGFGQNSVPINGIAVLPEGAGPFPVALFIHGNHGLVFNDPWSEEGYIYLCELLASYGIIGITVDENFLNGFNTDNKNLAARTLLVLEHLKQFRTWNTQAGHSLFGKIDLSRVLVAGHSMGGQVAVDACAWNSLGSIDVKVNTILTTILIDGSGQFGPYNFGISGVIGIAPSRYYELPQLPPVVSTNVLYLQGSSDEDFGGSTRGGYAMYDSINAINLQNPTAPDAGFKSLVWIYEGLHAFFNSVWTPGRPPEFLFSTMTRPDQMQIARVFISAFAQKVLLGKTKYNPVIENITGATPYLPAGRTVVTQYQAKDRLFINHFENDTYISTLSPPVMGNTAWSGLSVEESLFDESTAPYLQQATHGLKLTWNASGGRYSNYFSSGLDAGSFAFIAMRAGQSAESGNVPSLDQDFSLNVTDVYGHSTAIAASSLSRIPYPAESFSESPSAPRIMVMQTIRFPLSMFTAQGIDIHQLFSIELVFDRTSSGVLYFDDIQLSQ